LSAQAQFDSTSTVLLRPSGKPVKPQSLDSSRYKVRQPEARKDDDEFEEKPGTYIPTPVSNKKKSVQTNVTIIKSTPPALPPNPPPMPQPAPIVPEGSDPIPVTKSEDPRAQISPPHQAPVEPTPAPPQPPVTLQVKELIMGGSNQEIDDYHKQIHPEDPRANVLSVSLAPAYYYNDSSSSYSFRRYNSTGPGIGLGMNLWLTPFFGLQSKFFSSVSASQRNGEVNSVPTDLQNFEAGLRFRRHFGYSRKSAQLSWGLDYHDSMNKISKESTASIGRKSSGLSLVVEGEIPTSNVYSHTFELDIRPRLKHSEMNTGVEARSGTKNETNAIGLTGGGVWTLDRHNQVFWKGQYLVERNLFDGQSTLVDPSNDKTPEGVSVTNTLVIFYFGFRWGS
jgi:hypothetical protein